MLNPCVMQFSCKYPLHIYNYIHYIYTHIKYMYTCTCTIVFACADSSEYIPQDGLSYTLLKAW